MPSNKLAYHSLDLTSPWHDVDFLIDNPKIVWDNIYFSLWVSLSRSPCHNPSNGCINYITFCLLVCCLGPKLPRGNAGVTVWGGVLSNYLMNSRKATTNGIVKYSSAGAGGCLCFQPRRWVGPEENKNGFTGGWTTSSNYFYFARADKKNIMDTKVRERKKETNNIKHFL